VPDVTQKLFTMKLLTIAIPTFNRANLLDKQLTWLAQAVKGFEDEIEIFVSDNGSTDNTQAVIEKWKGHLSNITFNSCKNVKNIGVMRNIMNCLHATRTKYVWTIGDDDPIQDRAIVYVINKFKQYDDVSLVFLNFSGRNQITGEPSYPATIVGNRWFDIENEDGSKDGKEVFEHCMIKSVGAVIFLTAIIYRTDLVLRAVRTWPEGVNNWMYLAYLAGYCAANGRTIVTKENYVECILAVSHWQQKPQTALLMQYKHLPEVVRKLAETGYSKQFYREMMVRTFRDANVRVFLGALRRWPALSVRTLIPFLTAVGGAVVGGTPSSKEKNGARAPVVEAAPSHTEA
jgi:glycosyltransferase involved in cell wall biosynthesis